MGVGLRVGLEIHTQLRTGAKLFSLAANTTGGVPPVANSQVALFDAGIPGTQPRLNPQALLGALTMAKWLNCTVPPTCTFDRKHYFYADQPLGYQITQHFHPVAREGHYSLLRRHHPRLSRDVKITIQQLQLEQDTGRSVYRGGDTVLVDYSRAGIPLVEMVTGPDFQSVDEVRAFLQVYVRTLRDLGVCVGDLESGSIRVDVNVSVGAHSRVEVKNLPTISAIVSAIRYEEQRQVERVAHGELGNVETRGWDGKQTVHLRSKESMVDYRYVPDMELPSVKLDVDDIMANIVLPTSYEEKLDRIMALYGVALRDARVLLNENLLGLYEAVHTGVLPPNQPRVVNWIVHELMGALSKSGLPAATPVAANSLAALIDAVGTGKILAPNAKTLLLHLVNNPADQARDVLDLAKEFGLEAKAMDAHTLEGLVADVLATNEDVVAQIRAGKRGKVNFLLGLALRKAQGSAKPETLRELLLAKLDRQ